MGWKKAPKTFGVPKTTLTSLSSEKYGNSEQASKTKVDRPTVLTSELEKKLVQYCLTM